ncbi:Tic22 family protein [Aphanothece sacrum]|uniref:Tic22-like family protein n=2 Tax=Aphanothece sacrum TaxID=1122 RepID=A0A401IG96_APHSA|nr:Tic22 family protein [Aphanothece sacrum]GBF80236.1 Tic22-like family protein [Aphanothece sacrum FPU1]
MKTLKRWGITLSLIASTLIPTWLSQSSAVLALPEADIVQMLSGIPVFTFLDAQGAPLVAQLEDKTIFASIFMSQRDAQQALAQFQKDKPDLASQYKIKVISLGKIYQFARKNSTQSQRFVLQYVPTQVEFDAAKKVAGINGQPYQGGVPVYIANGGPGKGYLTIKQNNQDIVPVFFEQGAIQKMVDELKKNNPEVGSTLKIEVIPLNILIANLEQQDDEFWKSIRLWPSQEMIQIIRANAPNKPK